MFASMGRDARGFYGLNLQGKSRVDGSSIGFDVSNTPSSAWQNAVYLWESAKGANNALGYTYNTPQIGLIAQKLDRTNNLLMDTESDLVQSVFIVNGYQPSNTAIATYKEPTVLLYSALGQMDDKTNGTSYKAADLGRDLATITLKTKDGYTCNVYTDARDNIRKGGTASTPRLVDVNMDGIFDVMYVGDQCGNMWRVNMDRSDIANWKDNVHLIYKAPNNSAPITTRPAVYRINNETLKNTQGQNYGEFVVLFGTGTNIYQSDITLPDQQYFMGVFDSTDSDKSNQRDAATINQLVTQTLTENTVFKDGKNEVIRNITGYRDNNPNSPYYVPPMDRGGKGWKLELTGIKSATGLASSSEMVVTDSQVLMQTVYFTTVKYLKENTQNNVDDGQETCYPKVSNTNTLVESFLMSLDVLTGSNPDPEKSDSYLSGWDAVNKDQNNMPKPIGGVLLEGAASGMNIVSVNKVQSSINPNGGGESCEDGLDLGNKDCLTSDEWYAMFADQNGVHNDKLEIKRCPVGGNRLIRINQRQVY